MHRHAWEECLAGIATWEGWDTLESASPDTRFEGEWPLYSPTMTLADPVVSLTDYGLAVECAVLSGAAFRSGGDGWLAAAAGALFLAVGLAAFLGGTVHGFLTDHTDPLHTVVWRVTIGLLALTGYLGILAGTRIMAGLRAARVAALAFTVPLIAYWIFVAEGHDDFRVAIAAYSVGLVVLALACLLAMRDSTGGGSRWLLVGIALSVVASLIQQDLPHNGWPLSMRNGVYHVLEAIALWLMFAGFKAFIRQLGGSE